MKPILITGAPGIGKTTLVKKLIKILTDSQAKVDGFITEEIRNERFHRTGFSIRLIKTTESGVLADKIKHPPSPNTRNLGQYTVYVKDLEDLVIPPVLSVEEGVLIIDEIGKMELFSRKFEEVVTTVFKKGHIKILATVPIKGPPFVENLKRDNGCQLITVTTENRDNLVKEIADMLLDQK